MEGVNQYRMISWGSFRLINFTVGFRARQIRRDDRLCVSLGRAVSQHLRLLSPDRITFSEVIHRMYVSECRVESANRDSCSLARQSSVKTMERFESTHSLPSGMLRSSSVIMLGKHLWCYPWGGRFIRTNPWWVFSTHTLSVVFDMYMF